jgi:hypothetical protein
MRYKNFLVIPFEWRASAPIYQLRSNIIENLTKG